MYTSSRSFQIFSKQRQSTDGGDADRIVNRNSSLPLPLNDNVNLSSRNIGSSCDTIRVPSFVPPLDIKSDSSIENISGTSNSQSSNIEKYNCNSFGKKMQHNQNNNQLEKRTKSTGAYKKVTKPSSTSTTLMVNCPSSSSTLTTTTTMSKPNQVINAKHLSTHLDQWKLYSNKYTIEPIIRKWYETSHRHLQETVELMKMLENVSNELEKSFKETVIVNSKETSIFKESVTDEVNQILNPIISNVRDICKYNLKAAAHGMQCIKKLPDITEKTFHK